MKFNDGRWGLTAERLREVMYYDPDEGVFLCIKDGLLRKAGTERDDGYITIRVDGHPYLAHRLAWLYVHGEWPSGEIDHINCRPFDNRMENLRIATRRLQSMNKARYKPRPRVDYVQIGEAPEGWENRLPEDEHEIAEMTGAIRTNNSIVHTRKSVKRA